VESLIKMLNEIKQKISNTLKGKKHSLERVQNIKKSLQGKNTRERKIKTSITRGMQEFVAIEISTNKIVWKGLLKSECSEYLSINRYKIRDILYGIRKSYKGYTFKYIDISITHPDKVLLNKEQKRKQNSIRIKNDLCFKLRRDLRCRLNKAIRNNQKTGSAVRDLGCSIEEFKTYMESKFQPGMSWNNHGNIGWHIDHVVPMSKFDLPNPEELKKACHYTNLQPLWAKDNLAKSNK